MSVRMSDRHGICWQCSVEREIMTGNRSGRHFLQIPGPTNVPDRVLRAIQHPTIDHRGPRFQQLARDVLDRLRLIFKTDSPIVIFPYTELRSDSTGEYWGNQLLFFAWASKPLAPTAQ